jgi:hypothetical protein
VTVRLAPWRGGWPRAIVFAVIVALLPLPALAGEPGSPAKGKSLTAAVERAAQREVLRTRAVSATAQQGTQKAGPDLGSWGFFKTPLGVGVLALLAAGTSYAVYSKFNDRVRAPGR